MGKVRPAKNADTVYQPTITTPHAERLPMITCVKCGQKYHYRGSEDDAAIELGAGLCTECQIRLKGGAYDGMTVGDIYDN